RGGSQTVRGRAPAPVRRYRPRGALTNLIHVLLRHPEMRRLGNAGVDVLEDDLLATGAALDDTPRENIGSIVGLGCLLGQVILDGLVAAKRMNVVVRPPNHLHGKFF